MQMNLITQNHMKPKDKNYILKKLKNAKNNFKECNPPRWAKNPHIQTLYTIVKRKPKIEKQQHDFLLELENENERLYIEYIEGHTNIVVYLFHGLTGSSKSTYMQRLAKRTSEMGHHVYLCNHRCSGAGAGLATTPYHPGRAEDLSSVIAYGKKKHPKHLHIGVGFSLSGNAILLLGAKIRGKVQPDLIISINPPIDMETTSLQFTKGLNRMYDFLFLKEIRRQTKENNVYTKELFHNIKTVRQFDEAFTAKMSGFKDRKHFYSSCSAKPHIHKINVPTLIITTKDDPFVVVEQFEDLKFPENVILHVENFGGHLGYMSRKKLKTYDWLEQTLFDVVQEFAKK